MKKNLIAEVGTESETLRIFSEGLGNGKCNTTAAGQNFKYMSISPGAISCKYLPTVQVLLVFTQIIVKKD